jgi:hypothetical protein
MDEFFDGGAIHTHNFVPAVNQGVCGYRCGQLAFVGHHL